MTRDGTLLTVFAAVGGGAAIGACLRWALSYCLNSGSAILPLGTLASNLVGGFLIGAALAYFAAHPSVSPAARLFLVTGFLGGLTTFSTFSAENVAMLMAGEYVRAFGHAALHMLGSFAMTAAGMWSVRAAMG